MYGLFDSAVDARRVVLSEEENLAQSSNQWRLHGDSWQVLAWDVPLDPWPAANDLTEAIGLVLGLAIQ